MDIYIQKRQTGKTTMLVEQSAKTGAIIVVPTYKMAEYVERLAHNLELDIPRPISVTTYIQILANGGLGKTQKYLVDELQMMLEQMNVEAATVDSRYVEVISDPQKEGL